MTEGNVEKALAQVVVEDDCVTLYYVGDRAPERIPRDKANRVTISLRDPAGPLVWIDEPEDVSEASGPDS